MKKRLLSVLLTMCLLFTAMPALGVSAEAYMPPLPESGLNIGGSYVQGMTYKATEGKVSVAYSYTEKMLVITLDNATIDVTTATIAALNNQTIYPTKIILKGTNTINSNSRAFYSGNEEDLMIEGEEGSGLIINSADKQAVQGQKNIIIKNTDVKIHASGTDSGYGIYSYNGDLLAQDSNISILVEESYNNINVDNMVVTGGAIQVENKHTTAILVGESVKLNEAEVDINVDSNRGYGISAKREIQFNNCPNVVIKSVETSLFKQPIYEAEIGVLFDNTKAQIETKGAAICCDNADVVIRNNSDVSINATDTGYTSITVGEIGSEKNVGFLVENSKFTMNSGDATCINNSSDGDVIFRNSILDLKGNRTLVSVNKDIVLENCKNVNLNSDSEFAAFRSQSGDIRIEGSKANCSGGHLFLAWEGNLFITNSDIEGHSQGTFTQMFRSGKKTTVEDSNIKGTSEAGGFAASNLDIIRSTVDITTGMIGYMEFIGDSAFVLQNFNITDSDVTFNSLVGANIMMYYEDYWSEEMGFEKGDVEQPLSFNVKDSELNLNTALKDPSLFTDADAAYAIQLLNVNTVFDGSNVNIDYDVAGLKTAAIYTDSGFTIRNESQVNITSEDLGVYDDKYIDGESDDFALKVENSYLKVDAKNQAMITDDLTVSGTNQTLLRSHDTETITGIAEASNVKVTNGGTLYLENDHDILANSSDEETLPCNFLVDKDSTMNIRRGSLVVDEKASIDDVKGNLVVEGILAMKGLKASDIASKNWSGNGLVKISEAGADTYFSPSGAALSKAEISGYTGGIEIYYDAAAGEVTGAYADGKITLNCAKDPGYHTAYGKNGLVNGAVVMVPEDSSEKIIISTGYHCIHEEIGDWEKVEGENAVCRKCTECEEVIEKETYVPGDVNGNGKVDAADALAVLKNIAGLNDLSVKEKWAGNTVDSANLVLTASDALQILKYLAGLVDAL